MTFFFDEWSLSTCTTGDCTFRVFMQNERLAFRSKNLTYFSRLLKVLAFNMLTEELFSVKYLWILGSYSPFFLRIFIKNLQEVVKFGCR